MKTTDYPRGRWLPGTPPRVRTTQTRNNSSSSNCYSNSCPWLWLRKIARKWKFELDSIANASKQIRKNGKGRCQKHTSGDLTRPGQRPGEFEGIRGEKGDWRLRGCLQTIFNDNSLNHYFQKLRTYILIDLRQLNNAGTLQTSKTQMLMNFGLT